MKFMDVKKAIRKALPAFPGWEVYDTMAPAGQDPPWIVIKIVADRYLASEAAAITTGTGILDIRVVSLDADSCDIVCDKLHELLDGKIVKEIPTALVFDADSGVYASELKSTQTGQPFVMRVVRWTFGWPQ